MARQLIYSATYSNVPVYEFNIEGNHVMRRRSDDWINATHILKVAGYDKPARTRILEREVQKGTHEKVQGGYGKYQGTWIPLNEGRVLAERNKVLEKLLPIFDFVPGDRSPPPAPKHATASSRPRAPRAVAGTKRKAAAPKAARNGGATSAVYSNVPDYEQLDIHGPESETPDNVTVASESVYMDEYDEAAYIGTGKRRRMDYEGNNISQKEMEHRLWSEELLDYFMLEDSPPGTLNTMPQPPQSVDMNAPIDDKSHCALHWAAAMGDIECVKTLIRDYHASIEVVTKNGQTPLMRAVMFTNCYDKQNMERIAALLIRTVNMQDWFGQTVFHHIAEVASDKKKHACARYYIDSILNKMQEMLQPDHIEGILNAQDQDGNTAITIAARHGARKCIRSLLGRHARVDISNSAGETADQLMRELRQTTRGHDRSSRRQESSSPFAADGAQDHTLPFEPLTPGGIHRRNPSTPVPATYKTPSALALSTQILPNLMSKGRTLASALEDQITSAQADLSELERLTATRRSEIAALQAQSAQLEAAEEEEEAAATRSVDHSHIPSYQSLTTEIATLNQELTFYLTVEQAETLQHALNASSPPPVAAAAEPGTAADTSQLVATAKRLVALQMERRELVDFVGRKMAESGYDPKSEEYKRLITGALGVKEQDIAALLPDMVTELEEWRGLQG